MINEISFYGFGDRKGDNKLKLLTKHMSVYKIYPWTEELCNDYNNLKIYDFYN